MSEQPASPTLSVTAIRWLLRGVSGALLGAACTWISIAAAPGFVGVCGALLALLMMAIAVSDLRRYIVPDYLTLAGLGVGLLHAAAGHAAGHEPVWAIAAAGMRGAIVGGAFLILRQGYARLRGRQGLGLGDVKLAGVAGVWLDWSALPLAIEFAAVTALGAYLIRHLVFRRPLLANEWIPFGFFLAPAIWICWLLQVAVLGS